MPCTNYSADEEKQMANQTLTESRKTIRKLTKELNHTTKLFCEVLSKLQVREFSEETQSWWNKHSEKDKQRQELELAETVLAAAQAKVDALKNKK